MFFFLGEISLFFDKKIGKFLDFFVVLSINLINFSLFFVKFHENFDVKKRRKEHCLPLIIGNSFVEIPNYFSKRIGLSQLENFIILAVEYKYTWPHQILFF
jgi:hypothetical protein